MEKKLGGLLSGSPVKKDQAKKVTDSKAKTPKKSAAKSPIKKAASAATLQAKKKVIKKK